MVFSQIAHKNEEKRTHDMTPYKTDTIYEVDRLYEFADNWEKITDGFPEATHFRFMVNTSGVKLLVLLKEDEKASWAYTLRDLRHSAYMYYI